MLIASGEMGRGIQGCRSNDVSVELELEELKVVDDVAEVVVEHESHEVCRFLWILRVPLVSDISSSRHDGGSRE